MSNTKNSHIFIPRSILERFESYRKSLKKIRLYYYDFGAERIKTESAKMFNTEKGYYSDEIEEKLCKEAETGIGRAISAIAANYNKYGANATISAQNQRHIIKYLTYQLLRDERMAKRFINEAPTFNNSKPKEVKESLIKLQADFNFLDELFLDIGLQIVFNKTIIPFILTASTSTYSAYSNKYYIIQLTLTPNIAILITNIESFKKTLKTDQKYGIITIYDKKWIRKYNLVMFRTAKHNEPHIAVSSDEIAFYYAKIDNLKYI